MPACSSPSAGVANPLDSARAASQWSACSTESSGGAAIQTHRHWAALNSSSWDGTGGDASGSEPIPATGGMAARARRAVPRGAGIAFGRCLCVPPRCPHSGTVRMHSASALQLFTSPQLITAHSLSVTRSRSARPRAHSHAAVAAFAAGRRCLPHVHDTSTYMIHARSFVGGSVMAAPFHRSLPNFAFRHLLSTSICYVPIGWGCLSGSVKKIKSHFQMFPRI